MDHVDFYGKWITGLMDHTITLPAKAATGAVLAISVPAKIAA